MLRCHRINEERGRLKILKKIENCCDNLYNSRNDLLPQSKENLTRKITKVNSEELPKMTEGIEKVIK